MKYLNVILISAFFAVFTLSCKWYNDAHKQHHIVVIVPSYNNQAYYKKNLDSIYSQDYTNFHVIYINDCSSDNTYQLVKEYIDQHDLWNMTTLINNEHRCGAMKNIYDAVHSCADSDLVLLVDGDDSLVGTNALSRINTEYVEKDVWITYGQFMFAGSHQVGFCAKYPSYIIEKANYRSYQWIASHPRTFYAWLFKQIKKEDLMYKGSFYAVTWDQALMYPMLEMAGSHVSFIPDVLYEYNAANPINDGRVRLPLVLECERIIRSKKKYSRLHHPIMSASA